MVAYNFQARFAPLVETGAKSMTIREIGRRRHARPGERLQLYTGQRTKGCRKLLDAVVTGTQSIQFHADRRVFTDAWLTDLEVEILARLDGFASGADFLAFHSPPEGIREAIIIEWGSPSAAMAAE